MRYSLRVALLSFIIASIAVGVVVQSNIKTHEEAVYHWPSLETFVERRTLLFDRIISHTLKNSEGRVEAYLSERDLFSIVRATPGYG